VPLRYLRSLLLAALAFLAAPLASPQVAPPRPRPTSESLRQPPVPNDPLELVTSGAQPLQNAEERAAALNMLSTARSLSNLRGHPYDLKTSFTTTGTSSSDGAWNLRDTSPSADLYRWTAQGPSYSVINLFTHRMLYCNQASGVLPLRLAQVRTAIFFNYQPTGPRASIRTAHAALNGTEVSCVLLSHRTMAIKQVSAGRGWNESEYCVDAKSGLLVTYSPAPGLYVSYDYSEALHFHDKIIPGKFTITQGDQTIIRATMESVSDPAMEPALFEPAGLNQIGVGPVMSLPWFMSSFESRHGHGSAGMVVLHGMLSSEGVLHETEVISSSDSGLNARALKQAIAWQNWRGGDEDEPGATPQSHEVFFIVQFGPA